LIGKWTLEVSRRLSNWVSGRGEKETIKVNTGGKGKGERKEGNQSGKWSIL